MSKLPCPPELWPQFSRLLDEALELGPHLREDWLCRLPAEYEALRAPLRKVLDAESRNYSTPFLEQLGGMDVEEQAFFFEGQCVGPYRLLGLLGRGGMGEVWRAERMDGELNREVALKLPLAWMPGSALSRRLARERDILAALSHPHIAQIFDAGVSESGQAFLALELVHGQPIDEHCRQRRLDIPGRIRLFFQVLSAVAYAHGRLVVHRDLKPSNILVTEAGQVKLLDFGIAKLVDEAGASTATDLTRMTGRALTPQYSAPEQLAGDAITVATDVYVLGILLFELLTARRLFRGNSPSSDLRETGFELPLASSSVPADGTDVVGGLVPRQLRRRLRGDLDAITARALAPRPERRYPSVDALAEDLQRHLDLKPIHARRITRLERSLRFVRRHALAVGLGSFAALSLAFGLAGALWQADRASAAAFQARQEAQRANAIKDFLIGVFRASDRTIARERPAGDMSVRELLDLSMARLDTDMPNQPETRLELLGVAANIYDQWHAAARFEAVNEQRRKLAVQLYGPTHPAVIRSLLGKIWFTLEAEGKEPVDRAALLQQIDGLIRQGGHERSVLRAEWWMAKALAVPEVTSGSDERLGALEHAIDLYRQFAPDDPNYAFNLGTLAYEYFLRENYLDARDAVQKAIDAMRALPDGRRNDRNLADFYGALGSYNQYLGDGEGAARAYRAAAELHLKTYGSHDANYRFVSSLYARLKHRSGDALTAHQELERLLGSVDSGEVMDQGPAMILAVFGQCLLAEERAEEALPLLRRAVEIYSAGHLNKAAELRARMDLAEAYSRSGDHARAETLLREMRTGDLADHPPSAEVVLLNRERWARLLLRTGDLAAAEEQFAEVLRLGSDPHSSVLPLAYAGLARVALARKQPQAALAGVQRALDSMERVSAVYDLRLQADLWSLRAEALDQNGDRAQAEEWRQRAQAERERLDGPVARRPVPPLPG